MRLHRKGFNEIWYLKVFRKSVEKTQNLFKVLQE
jgi:hypothetical protein